MAMKWIGILLLLLPVSLGVHHASFAAPSENLIEVQVKGITVDPNGQVPVVILEAPATQKAFPMWIGRHEAQAIALEMQGIATPRPLTHTLMKNMLLELHVDVQRIVINNMENNTFYASITFQQGTIHHTLDARPSDAIALALGTKSPIFVAPHVLESIRTLPVSPPPPALTSAKKFGMHMQSISDDLAHAFSLPDTHGVLVAFVETDSQADRDGIQRGDVITRVDDKAVQNLADLLNTFEDKSPAQHVLQITRNQQSISIMLHLPATE
jgi:bifunctional DNase/RNase